MFSTHQNCCCCGSVLRPFDTFQVISGAVNLGLQQKNYFFKWVQPVVRHRLTYIKMFVLTSSLRKTMLTSWHFGAGGDILGQKHVFLTKKMRKTGIILQNSQDPSKGRNVAWLTSERVLNNVML